MSKLIYNQLANHKLFNKSVKFGLKRIKLALELLGNPERKLKNVINVIGESGKLQFEFFISKKQQIAMGGKLASIASKKGLSDISNLIVGKSLKSTSKYGSPIIPKSL